MIKQAPQPARDATLDVAKGMAIVLVVYGHCLRGLTSAGMVGEQSWLQFTDYLIYCFHMPLFFFVSGLFVRSSINKGASQFWRGKAQTIVYPYFLWSLLQGAVQITLAGTGATNGEMQPMALVKILWEPISPFWFLYALFFAMAAAYVLRATRPEFLAGLALVALLSGLLGLPQVLEDIAYGTFYLALGMVAIERGWAATMLTVRAGPAAMIAAVFIMAAGLSLFAELPSRLAFPAALAGIAATLAISSIAVRKWPPLAAMLAHFGRASLAIYVMHLLVIGFFRVLLVKGAGITDATVLLTTCTVAGVIVPVLGQAMLSRMRLSAVFGLPQLQQGPWRKREARLS